jgi:hypothetical protein
MTSVLRVCFIHKYERTWHLKFVEIYEHSVTFDQVSEEYLSLAEAREALIGFKPDVVKLIEQDAGELWG